MEYARFKQDNNLISDWTIFEYKRKFLKEMSTQYLTDYCVDMETLFTEGNGIGDIVKGTIDSSFDCDKKMFELFTKMGMNQIEGEAFFQDYVLTCEAGQIFEDTYLETKVRSIDKFNKYKDGMVTAIGIGALIISLLFPGTRVSVRLSINFVSFKKFIIIDSDKVDESNLNRQIIATTKTIGKSKILFWSIL